MYHPVLLLIHEGIVWSSLQCASKVYDQHALAGMARASSFSWRTLVELTSLRPPAYEEESSGSKLLVFRRFLM